LVTVFNDQVVGDSQTWKADLLNDVQSTLRTDDAAAELL
jgi:hypothetical protein